MHMLDAWEQTAVYNPSDPTQKKIEKYAGVPGAYATFYFNRVPVGGQLKGLGGLGQSGLGLGLFTLRGLLVYSAIAAGLYLGATKTKLGRKAAKKVTGGFRRLIRRR